MIRIVALLKLLPAVTALADHSFSPLRHLGGIAPYFEPRDPPTSPSPPQGCSPVRAAYLSRHAAIYANDFDYEEYMQPFIEKLQNRTGVDWSKIPSLDFLAGWTAPVSEAEEELLTRLGKLEATQLAISLSFRYPTFKLPQKVWTSSAERTNKSAQAFVRGLEMDENTIKVVLIDESEKEGANSLTPYKGCPAYSSSAGSEQSAAYRDRFTKPITARLNALAPSFNFTSKDVYGMMELCGYESVIRGSSPFCDLDLFSPDEWLSWEYSADIQYHYNVGYGSNVAGVFGLPWLSATADLMLESSKNSTNQDLYVSFTHRELPPAVLVAMGLFNNSDPGGLPERINQTMPLDRINYQRAWQSSKILPFLGNIAIEKLQCAGSYGFQDGEYYRVLVNNSPQQLPQCNDGPGTSCSRSSFETYVQARQALFQGYSTKCKAKSGNLTETLTIYTDPSIGKAITVGKRAEGEWGLGVGQD